MLKHGIQVDEDIRQALVEAGLISRQVWGWTLTECGEIWEKIGYDCLRRSANERARFIDACFGSYGSEDEAISA